jgi:hypothetical protein
MRRFRELRVGALHVESSLSITHNLHTFNPITYTLSSEKTVSKFCLSKCNLQRYNGGPIDAQFHNLLCVPAKCNYGQSMAWSKSREELWAERGKGFAFLTVS